MINATSPNQEGVEGTDSRRRLDDHRRISDTGHIYLLVGNNVVLPHQGGIFLSSFATGYISLRNSWALGPPMPAPSHRPGGVGDSGAPTPQLPRLPRHGPF